jgi:type IV pilus assembly protein PilM
LRNITLPQLSGEELNEAAKFKVKRHLPFSVDDAYVEVSDRQPGDRDENQCLVIAVPKAVIDSRAEALVWAGLNPVRAELEGQAILRVVEQKLSRKGALWRDASLTIIDVGATFTHMYVVQNQRLQFIRGVKFGSESLYRAVATRMEVTVAEAVALVDGPNTKLSPEGVLGFQGEREIALVDLSAELDRLLREVQRLMRYFRSLHAERSYAGILDHAVLCGGFVGLSGFGEFLERNLQLKVEHARPIAGLMTRFNQETFNSVSNRQEAYTVVMGLAMSGIDRDQAVWGGAETSEFRWTRTG